MCFCEVSEQTWFASARFRLSSEFFVLNSRFRKKCRDKEIKIGGGRMGKVVRGYKPEQQGEQFCASQGAGVFWFGLDKCQVPTKTTLSLPLLSWMGRGNMMKGSRVETGTGRDHSPIIVTDKTD